MYKLLYKDIIDNAKAENRIKKPRVYYEWHHIVPDFLFKHRSRRGPSGHLDGNPNSVDNLVLLTFKEHLMAHYYLYEIYKDTRYGYAAGSALQFFYTKATGKHKRQQNLSKPDEEFLNEMLHLREIGIKSISAAKSGKMPAVDAHTREKIGSVPVDHPKVISGEWIHHSKGQPYKGILKDQKGSNNNNFREMTFQRKERLFDCVSKSLIDGNYLSIKALVQNLKEEFTEFKKISLVWVCNNFGNINNLVDEFNKARGRSIVYFSYYRGKNQRAVLRNHSLNYVWVTNGYTNTKIRLDEIDEYLNNNPAYTRGRINYDKD